jgi:hypothetical protein
MVALLRACQVVLHEEQKDPARFLKDAWEEAVELDVLEGLDIYSDLYTPTDAVSSSSEITNTLATARAAYENNHDDLCRELAFNLLLNLNDDEAPEERFPRLVARICDLRSKPQEERLGEVESILEGLERLQGQVGEDERAYWVGVVRRIVEEEW